MLTQKAIYMYNVAATRFDRVPKTSYARVAYTDGVLLMHMQSRNGILGIRSASFYVHVHIWDGSKSKKCASKTGVKTCNSK